jgi:hypothetical protein
VKCVLSGKAKGRHAYRMRVSHLSKERRAYRTHICPRECSLCQHAACPLERIRQTYVPNGHAALGRKKQCVEHKFLEFFDPVVSHGFKSIVACVLGGEVGLNFYTVLDKVG